MTTTEGDREFTDTAAGYQFGPRETRGLLLGLRAGQLAAVIVGLVGLVACLSAGRLGAVGGLVIVVAAVAVAFVPIGGRTSDQWLPIATRFAVGRWTGRHHFRAQLSTRQPGSPQSPMPLNLPGALSSLVVIPAKVGGDAAVGVVKDPGSGTYTVVAAVQGSAFALLDTAQKDRRIADWGGVLAQLAREASPIARVQWVERALPEPGDALERFWAAAGGQGSARAAASYRQLIASGVPVTQAHESYLAVAIDARRARRSIRRSGGGDTGAVAVLLREARVLSDQLTRAQLDLAGWLPPRGLAAVLRTAFEPGSVPVLSRRGATARAGVDPAASGPVAARNQWSAYRTDDGWHATYWIAEWPRMRVGADFLTPLLLATTCRRTVALVAEPIGPRKAAQEVRAARTAELANAAMRRRAGQVTTERQRAEAEEVDRRERELVAGHAEFRFTGYVTVTARSEEELDESCAQVEHLAHQSLLEIRRLYGEQEEAFAATLPLARGLR